MNFLDSMKPMFRSQHCYRLAVFRVDKKGSKVITDKYEMILSVLLLGIITVAAGYIGQKVYFSSPDNSNQTSKGELILNKNLV